MISIEALAPTHDRRTFSCGVEALDEYLRRFARQHADAKISRTYVAVAGSTVRGFYSLAMSAIRKENLPAEHLNRFPNFPRPVARLARLAVEKRHQRQGLGELLLADALQRCLRLSSWLNVLSGVRAALQAFCPASAYWSRRPRTLSARRPRELCSVRCLPGCALRYKSAHAVARDMWVSAPNERKKRPIT